MLNRLGKNFVAALMLGVFVLLAPLTAFAAQDGEIVRLELNVATKAELMSLGILTEAQVDAIIRYRQGMGDFMSYEELLEVGLDMETIDALRPLTTINYIATDCSC